MTPEQQRIAIAEACGWKFPCEACAANGIAHRWRTPNDQGCRDQSELPDYLNDLNAMHEAEKVLASQDVWWKYCTQLNTIVCADADEVLNQDPETLWCMIHATAAQRAEAFLRTIGKWTDNEKGTH